MMKLGAILLFSALLAQAQPPFEIRGTVIEPGLGGIAGAEVRAQVPGNATPVQFLSAFTDARGEFVIRTSNPGPYFLQATRDGYVAPLRYESSTRVVTVDTNRPSGSAQLNMLRPAEIVGRVLDAETREPIANIDVFILQKAAAGWNQAVSVNPKLKLGDAAAKTDARGNFAAVGILPGEYVASAIRLQGTTWRAEYSPEDFKVVDQSPEMLFWPGGTPPELARTIPVGSGAVVSFGDILLQKVPHYRAHISLEQGSCPPGESMRVSVSGPALSNQQPSAFACGSELLLRDLMPGTYHLYAVSDWQGMRDNIEYASWASVDFAVGDKNIEVTMTPQAGVVMEGQFVAPEGLAVPELLQLGVRPLPIAEGFQPEAEQFLEALPDGKFRMTVAPRPQTFRAGRFSDVYVKEVRYNGSPLRDMTLNVNPGAGAQRLEVLFDNKFGALSGTVTETQRITRPIAFLWTEENPIPYSAAVAEGKFHFPKLPPGDYRIGVRPLETLDSRPRLPDPNTTAPVTIRPGATTTINVPAAATSR